MPDMMKAVAAIEKDRVGIVEIPVPVPGDYECLTKITYCGICNGTDLKLISNKVADKETPYPTILGKGIYSLRHSFWMHRRTTPICIRR